MRVLARRLLYALDMQHSIEARHGKRSHGRPVARSFFLVAMIALALPGLARAQAPDEAAPQAPDEAAAPQAAPETQALPDAPETQAPAAPAQALEPDAGTQARAASSEAQVLDVETPAQAPVAQPVVHATVRSDEKDVGFALGGSVLTTGLGLGVMIAGISGDNGALGLIGFTSALVGPSFGHFYAGETGRGMAHVGVRAGAAAMTVVGVAWTVSDLFGCLSFFGEQPDCSPNPAAPLLLAGGVVLGAGSIIYSIQDAPRAARRYNARARARQLMLVPAPMTGPDRTSGFGMQLGGSF